MKAVAVLALLALGTNPALAQVIAPSVIIVPTLDDVGLVALISLVGIVGGFVASRRRK